MDIYNERIAPLFKQSGMSDQELEVAIGLPRSMIYNWKSGRSKNYAKYCGKIAAYFGVTTDYLTGQTDNPTPAGKLSDPKRKAIELVLLLSDDEASAVVNVCEAFLKQR